MNDWALCGGIIERFGEPATWWQNQNEVLTTDAAQVPVADVLDQYGWLWEDDDLEITVNPAEYYAVAVEANGNLTLAHRDNGRLLLFAPDHSFTRVTPLAGSPPYSLHTRPDDLDRSVRRSLAAAVRLSRLRQPRQQRTRNRFEEVDTVSGKARKG